MNFKQEIEFYGEDLQDFEMSPFEMIETFHKRTLLHHHYQELTNEEKASLKEKDQYLLKIAKKVYEHMKKVYDFQNDKPMEEWWWHLDKVANHQLSIDVRKARYIKNHFYLQLFIFKQRKHMIYFWMSFLC